MAREQEDEDDFSFPTTTSSPPRFIGSPRLWRSSSYSLYVDEYELTAHDRKTIDLLSYIKKKGGDGDCENMDVIWEDLNYEEEIDGFRRRSDSVSCDYGRGTPEWRRKGAEYGEVAVACGGGKRPSMVVFVKVLKKLLLLPRGSRHWTVKK